MVVEIVHLPHYDLPDDPAMALQVLKPIKVDHPQLLVLHHLHQGPKGRLCCFYVVEENSCDHVQSLHVPQVHVVETVGGQHVPEHRPIEGII